MEHNVCACCNVVSSNVAINVKAYNMHNNFLKYNAMPNVQKVATATENCRKYNIRDINGLGMSNMSKRPPGVLRLVDNCLSKLF